MLVSGVECAKAMAGFTDSPLREELGICPCFLIQILLQKKSMGDLEMLWKSDKTVNIRN